MGRTHDNTSTTTHTHRQKMMKTAPVLKHSFSQDVNDDAGGSPLHIMLEHWEDVQPEAVEMLIKEKKLDVNELNSFGETAMHGALLCYRDDSDDDYYNDEYEYDTLTTYENVDDKDWWSWWNNFRRKKRSLDSLNTRTKRHADNPNFDGQHFLEIMKVMFDNGLDMTVKDFDDRNLFHCMARLEEDLRFENMDEILEFINQQIDSDLFVEVLEEDDVRGNTAIDYAEQNDVEDILEWVYEHEFV